MISLFSSEMLKLFPYWERDIMPFPSPGGGQAALLEQPQIFLQAMEIITSARANLKRD